MATFKYKGMIMAIEFYKNSDKDRNNAIFAINDKILCNFLSIFDAFREKTGVNIDLYGKTILYPNHTKLLANLLTEACQNKIVDKRAINDVLNFINFLVSASLSENVIVMEGE